MLNNITLVTLFEDAVVKNMNKTALVAGDLRLSYAELNAQANRIARALIARGVKPEDKIAVLLPRDYRVIVSIYGILKAGAAFIPVDPEYPEDRVEYYIKDSDSCFVISDKRVLEGKNFPNAVEFSDLFKECTGESNPGVNIDGTSLAYIIYTSGSTGLPKGAMLEHGGAVAFSACVPENDVVYQSVVNNVVTVCISTVAFDAFLLNVFTCFSNGLPLILADDNEAKNPLPLAELIVKHKADAIFGTTSRLLEYLVFQEFRSAIKDFKLFVIGGEMFSHSLFDRLRAVCGAVIINAYGPTETTIISNSKVLENTNEITVGRPLNAVSELIVDAAGNALSAGQEGELWIGGVRVSRGYYNRPELNAQKFTVRDGIRYFKSGDIARWTPAGEVVIIGRNDSQVKLNGLRIELGEVEAVLDGFPGVIECNAHVRVVNRRQHLCAWFTALGKIDIDELRMAMGKKLADYMVPTLIMQLDEMPHTLNGKIDVKNLPDIELKVVEIVPPETETEKIVLDAAIQVLSQNGTVEAPEFGVTNELALLGLSSLDATSLAAYICRETGKTFGLGELIRARTVRKIAAILDSRGREETQAEWQTFRPPPVEEYPLSNVQMGVYFECVRNPGSTFYNNPVRVDLPEGTDAARAEAALKAVVEAHTYIKARIVEHGDVVMQRRFDEEPPVVELISTSVVDFEAALEDFIKPFDIRSGEKLYRIKLYETPEGLRLLLDFHHIIFDGTSLDIFLRSFTAAYEGEVLQKEEWTAFDAAALEAEPSPDVADWYKNARITDKAWWTELIGDGEGATQLPTKSRSKAQRDDGSQTAPEVPQENAPVAQQIDAVSEKFEKAAVEKGFRTYGVTGAAYFLAALSITLGRFAGTRQTRLAIISAGRWDERFLRSFGMFVGTLPAVIDIPGEEDFYSFIRRVTMRFHETLVHCNYPYTELSANFQYSPQMVFAYQGTVVGQFKINGKTFNHRYLQPENTGFPILVAVTEKENCYELKIEYKKALFGREFMQTFLDCVSNFALEAANSENSTKLLSTISISTPRQRKQIAGFFRPLPKLWPSLELPVTSFEKQVEKTPDEAALIACDGTFTYRELNERANRVARALLERGLKRGEIVSLILSRTSAVVISMIGVVKAGGAYLPVDPAYPEDRISHYINDSASRFVISDNPSRSQTILFHDLLGGAGAGGGSGAAKTANLGLEAKEDDPFYIIYTSGSTGIPKGVALRHISVAALLCREAGNADSVCASKYKVRRLSMTTIAFDMFTWEVWTTFLSGATLILADDEEAKTPAPLAALAARTGANALNFTTARLQEYLKYSELRGLFENAKFILEAGEKFPAGLYEKIRGISGADILNGYGPSETTMMSNIALMKGGSLITAGPPVAGTFEEIIDIEGHPLPAGTVGELYIGGAGVALGYLNRPELNAEKFVTRKNAFGTETRFYKSGDLAKWTQDGEIVVIGRNDGQVKLRGLRIELGEIENKLGALNEIQHCVVKVRNIRGQDHLCAWFTSLENPSVANLREKLSKTLPEYMVPTAWMRLDDMPRTPNGKVDVRALPSPVFVSETEYIAPSNEIEKLFCSIFAKLLHIEKISAIDNFFQLGGTSLQAAEISLLAGKSGRKVSFGDVFSAPTPRGLSELLLKKSAAGSAAGGAIPVGGISKAGKGKTGGETGLTNAAADEARDYDYDAINTLLAANTFENFRRGNKGKLRPLGDVLLTGAPGFLGSHVLRELIEANEGKVYCMIRGNSKESAESRLKKTLKAYFNDDFAPLFGKRIFVVEGDICCKDDYDKLKERFNKNDKNDKNGGQKIGTLINCAANVKHFSAGTDIDDVNIGGAENGLAFARSLGGGDGANSGCRFIQISTYSVAGDSINGVPDPAIKLDENSLYFGQDTSNQYVHSKFIAERRVFEAILAGQDAKVIRLGNLQGRARDGKFQINYETNNFAGQMRAYAALGKISWKASGAASDLSPIDSTAAAIVRLAKTPLENCLFHAFSPYSVLYATLAEALTNCGVPVEICGQDEFDAAFEKISAAPDKAAILAPLIAYNREGARVVPIAADASFTNAVLLNLGFRWPLPGDSYFKLIFGNLKKLGFFGGA